MSLNDNSGHQLCITPQPETSTANSSSHLEQVQHGSSVVNVSPIDPTKFSVFLLNILKNYITLIYLTQNQIFFIDVLDSWYGAGNSSNGENKTRFTPIEHLGR